MSKKIYSVVAKTTKPVPYRLRDKMGNLINVPERFVINKDIEVVMEFTNEMAQVLQPYNCNSYFVRGELWNFKIVDHEISDVEYEEYKDSTQHKHALTFQDAVNRVMYMESQYKI